MCDLAGTIIDLVLDYLSPVDFMHTIETSKYLYREHRDKIQEKRKESLVRFMGYNTRDYDHPHMYRGTKLPNGKVEGKFEVLDNWYYMTADYISDGQVGYEFTYEYFQYRGKVILSEDRESFRNNLGSKFVAWEEIDASKMKLISKANPDAGIYGLASEYCNGKTSTNELPQSTRNHP